MLFSSLLTAVKARLDWDAYFSESPRGVSVIEEDRLDLLTEIETAMAKLGVCAIVSLGQIRPGQTGFEIVVPILLTVSEDVMTNRASSGTLKPADHILAKAWALMHNWTPSDIWSPFEFVRMGSEAVGENSTGVVWQLEMQTTTLTDVLITYLVTGSGETLTDDNGEEFIVSPTEA